MILKPYRIFITLFLVSCAGTPPIKEYSLAFTARSMAQKFESYKYAPKSYKKAEAFYKQGQDFFNQRLYGASQESFNKSQKLYERLENLSREKKQEKDQ